MEHLGGLYDLPREGLEDLAVAQPGRAAWLYTITHERYGVVQGSEAEIRALEASPALRGHLARVAEPDYVPITFGVPEPIPRRRR